MPLTDALPSIDSLLTGRKNARRWPRAVACGGGGDMEQAVRTPDGWALAVEDSGVPAGRPALVHGSTPCSRYLHGPWVADATGRGLRLIGYDRPGHGGSTPSPGYSVADCAEGVRAICVALEIDRLVTSAAGPTRWPVRRCFPN